MMLDKDYRKKAEQWITRSLDYHSRDRQFYYLKALEWYAKIQHPNATDHRAMANVYRKCAVNDFNADRNNDAATNYQQSIEKLLQIEHDLRIDDDYRDLTELYLDLADTCIYLANKPAADESYENAIQAFNFIKEKTDEEIALGDPHANFPLFYEYFQKITSERSYIASTSYRNHAQILQASHTKRMDDKSMADLFGTICIDEINGIGQMMGELAVTNAATPNFMPIRLDKPSTDVEYRALAIEYLRLTQTHIQESELADTIKTYGEALNLLKIVKHKNPSDQQIISSIEQQISFLKKREEKLDEDQDEYDDYDDGYDNDDVAEADPSESQALPYQNQQVTSSLIANIKMTMFGRQTKQQFGVDFLEEQDLDEQVNAVSSMNYD